MAQMTSHYPEAWKEYRARRFWGLVFMLGLILAPLIAHRVIGTSERSLPFVSFLSVVLFALTIIQGYRFALWPCPKCGKAFRGTIPFPRGCRHCGLPIGS